MRKIASETAPIRAALYARYSSDVQKDTSIEDQFAMLEKAAKRLGLALDKRHYYCDRAQVGTSLIDRPGLTRRLLDAAARRDFDAVLVEATDRLSRSQADLFWLADRFAFHEIKIFTQSGEVSEMQLTLDGHSNADFIKKLSIRVKRGHDRAVEDAGRFVTPPAYGYDSVPGKAGERVINEQEAEVVRRIFREYAAGMTPREIVAGLATDKVPSPSGAPFWSHQAIVGGHGKSSGLIRNRLYIGEYVKNRFYTVKNPATGKRVKRKADEADLIIVKKPELAIIDPQLWHAAHAVREGRAVKHYRAGSVRAVLPRQDYLLSGLLRCGACGGQMTVVATPASGKRVGCSNAAYRKTCGHAKSYNLNILTEASVERTREVLSDPEAAKRRAEARADEMAKLLREQNGERDKVQKKLDRVTLAIKRLADIAMEVDVPEVKEKIKAAEAERVSLNERLRLLGAETKVVEHPAARKALAKGIDTLRARLKKDPDDPECRLAFANFMESVVVHPTPSRAPYEIALYARAAAYFGGIELFPAKRSVREVIAAEGLPRSGSGWTGSSRRP